MSAAAHTRRLLHHGMHGSLRFCWRLLRVTAAVGIIMGVIIFSVVLYFAELGGAPPPEVPVTVPEISEKVVTPESQPAALEWMQWVFGPPPPKGQGDSPPPVPVAP